MPLVLVAELPAEAISMRERYRTLLSEAVMDRDDELADLNRTYRRHLDRIEANLREAGDLDGLLAVRRERDAFEQQGEAPSGASPVPELDALRRRYVEARTTRLREIYGRVIRFSDSYLAAMEQLEQRAVTADRISEAMAIRREQVAVREDSVVRDARRTLEEEEQAVAATVPVRDPAPAVRPLELPARVYRAGEEPQQDTSLRTLRFTSMQSRAMAVRVNAQLALYVESEDERGTRHRSSWSTTRTTSGYHCYFPRLTFTLSPNENLEQCIVVFEYFAQPMEGRGFSRIRTEHVPLSFVPGGETLVVDGAGIRLYQYESRYRASRGRYHSTSRAGATLYGLIVSLYDGDGNMVFQRTDTQQLGGEASDTRPARLNDPRGEIYHADAGRIRYFFY